MKNYLAFLLFLSLSSCVFDREQNAEDSEPAYFPLKEFIEVQAQKLDQKKIKKLVKIRDKSEQIEETLSEEEWLLELDLFLQADINKSALVQSYDTHRSNEYLIHELKPGEKSKIKKIVLRFIGDQVKEISFQSETDNIFYNSKTRGVLFMDSTTGLLDQINIEAVQDVVFLPPNKMIVNASVFPY